MRFTPYLATDMLEIDELPKTSNVRETYHIEILGSDRAGAGERIQQRVSVRSAGLDGARERALRLFARARTPQRADLGAEAVRVIDGAGREVFRWSRFDDPGQ